MVSSSAKQKKDEMNVAPFQDPWFGTKKCGHRRSNKELLNSLSVAMGKLQHHHLVCRLLLKEIYY